MPASSIARNLLWVALVLVVVGGIGAYRFFITTPELRFPQTEALWQLLPYLIMLIVVIALLLARRRPTASEKTNDPY